MGVPKSLDYKDFMSKSTSANPTTWDDMYRFFGNQGEITAALVKSLLYQPSTAYSIGAIVYSPNLPAGTIAKCTLAGTTGSVEPAWPAAGAAATDGTVRWLVENIRAANIPAAPDLTAYMKKDADSDLMMGVHKLIFGGTVISDDFRNTVPMFTIDATGGRGVNIKAPSVLVNGSPIATETDLSKCVKSINNITPDSNGNVTINLGSGGGTGGTNITVDSTLSSASTNPVQNKVIYAALNNKLDKNGVAAYATRDSSGNIIKDTYAKKSEVSGVVKSVNNITPDSNGNVTITVSGGGGVSTSESNTWTGKQTFQKMKFNFESYNAPRISGATDNPSESVAVYNVSGDFTLDMSELAKLLSNGDATVFTAYITANGSYTLSITNAGTLKYVGSATDLAITANGLLLNIILIKSSSGVLSSVAQASTLS